MTLRILVDMNLSPDWVDVLQRLGWTTIHWCNVGSPSATDREIMDWARANGHIVFTHDLDFGILLAHSKDGGPSVIQVRTQDVSRSILARSFCVLCERTAKHWRVVRCSRLTSLNPECGFCR